jgi:hypothetical protein
LAIIDGGHVGRAPLAGEQRHLADEVARTEPDLLPGDRHLDAARRDEIGPVRPVALADDLVARRRRARPEEKEELLPLLRLDRREDREAVDQLLLLQRHRRLARLVALPDHLQRRAQALELRPAIGPHPVGRAAPGRQPLDRPVGDREGERIERDREERPGKDQVARLPVEEAERDAEGGEDEGELADLRQARRHRDRRRHRVAEEEHDQERGEGLADDDEQHDGKDVQRLVPEDRRIEQHADRDEEQHREGVLQRQRVVRRAMAEPRLAQHHAGEERAEGEGDAEHFRRAEGDAERHRQHRQGEQLARSRARHLAEDPRHHPRSDEHGDDDEGSNLAERQSEIEEDVAGRLAVVAGMAAERLGERRQQHQRHHHGEVLDDQPADRDAPVRRVEAVVLLERAEKDDRARHRQAEAEDQSGAERPPP